MRRAIMMSFVAVVAMALFAPSARSAASAQSWSDARADLELSIKVSPQTINLASQADGDWVTVHTDIPYVYVDTATVALGGLPAASTYADDRGNLVAKFSLPAVRAIVAPPATELTLTGLTDDGLSFAGSDVVKVLAE